MVNIGSTATGAKVTAVKGDAAKLSLTGPACTEEGEKIALSRRIESEFNVVSRPHLCADLRPFPEHWRLIGWATITAGEVVEPVTS